MDTIIIQDLGVFYSIGVTEKERAQPQQLAVSVEMAHDFAAASGGDELANTIDYHAVSRRIIGFGQDRSWNLIETLAVELADTILREFEPERVIVEVKKFVIPEARHVAVRVVRSR